MFIVETLTKADADGRVFTNEHEDSATGTFFEAHRLDGSRWVYGDGTTSYATRDTAKVAAFFEAHATASAFTSPDMRICVRKVPA